MSPDSQDNFVKVYLLERLTRLKAQPLHRAAQGRIAAIAAAGGTVCAASDDLSVSVRHRVTVCCITVVCAVCCVLCAVCCVFCVAYCRMCMPVQCSCK